VTQSSTVEIRVAIQQVSLHLAAEKPVLGWGYGSFDEAKRASDLIVQGVPLASVLETTSHDTNLTILVELGLVGLVLYVAPFLLVGIRALRRPPPESERWLLASALGSLVVVYVTASTLDFRFFSFAQMLPFAFLGILRRLTAK
jgi:O-antigen ligase